jgi:hypothetical protein
MYGDRPSNGAVTEESIACQIAELWLLQPGAEPRTIKFNVCEKPELPTAIVVAACLEFAAAAGEGARTIALGRRLYDPGSPGMAFNLTECALAAAIDEVSAARRSVALADTFTWETQSVDTVVMKGSAVGQYLRSTGVICTTPDYNAYVRFTAASDSITGVTAGGELRIPDYSSRGLLMSDLLFGLDEDGPFVRGNAKLALVPPRQFRQKQPFRLFYEIYNLPAGAKYRTTLTFDLKTRNPLVRLFKGNTKFTVSFEGEAVKDGLVQEIRTIAPEIEDGEVQLTVKVENLATGETATNTEKLWILPPDDE